MDNKELYKDYLRKKVIPVLQPASVQVLQNSPVNPAAFLLNYLKGYASSQLTPEERTELETLRRQVKKK